MEATKKVSALKGFIRPRPTQITGLERGPFLVRACKVFCAFDALKRLAAF